MLIDLSDKYRELFRTLDDLQKMQCLYANKGLERIATPEAVKELIRLGVYSPEQRFPPSSKKQLKDTQIRMYEIVCQLKLLKEVEREQTEYDPLLKNHAERLDKMQQELKGVLFPDTCIKNSDVQKGILQINFGIR
ncbi:MAG: hypothetical protein Q8L29_01405 [archaeon]|nr:hypothetical protein [archaeon]